MKIFYQDSGYPIKRNVLDIPTAGYTPIKKIGPVKILAHIHYKLWGVNNLLNNSHWELTKRNDGIWHFFNGISFGKTPWVVTFETYVPRWNVKSRKILEKGVKALASKPCKKLIALSQCTKEFQIEYLEENFPSYTDHISEKITIIHPPQTALINALEEKKVPDDRLVFTVIGADFFRKGGMEILQVFDQLLKENANIEVTIISSLEYGDYASQTSVEDLNEAKQIIHKYPDNIHHFEKLPNKKVLQILKHSHIGLLLSYGDTYGYSVLEAQANGCPVITTDIRALPEINNNECGWIIKVPKNRWGNAVLKTAKDRSIFSDIVQKKFLAIMSDIIANPEQIAKKGRLSLKRIKEEHNPEKVARKLKKIYDESLK